MPRNLFLLAMSILIVLWPHFGWAQSPDPGDDAESAAAASQVSALEESHATVASPQAVEPLEERVRRLEARLHTVSAELPEATAESPASSVPDGTATTSWAPFEPARQEGAEPCPPNMPPSSFSLPLQASFGNGFELKTADGEFSLQFHDLTQIDGRFYNREQQDPVKETFTIPRQWWIFSGKLTQPIEYSAVIAEGFDTVNLLDAFINLHYYDEFQVKIGRYKTPYTYEFYSLPIQGLVQPERSLFFNNFGLNRDLGVMAHGTILNKSVDYGIGVFNGSRNGFVDTNDAKDLAGLLNIRPFQESESALDHLNLGGSFDVGRQDTTPVPSTLRTNVATSGNSVNGIPFLAFNGNVRETGVRQLWAAHAAWYYEQLSLLAEFQGGDEKYRVTTSQAQTTVPVYGWHVQAGLFLTGETVTMRNIVKPLNDFDLRPGKLGPGAWELTAKYDHLRLGESLFSAGLADATQWTNELSLTDAGVNWYWNQYLKLAFTWEHADFRTPVRYAPGKLQTTNDMFWTRMQLYF